MLSHSVYGASISYSDDFNRVGRLVSYSKEFNHVEHQYEHFQVKNVISGWRKVALYSLKHCHPNEDHLNEKLVSSFPLGYDSEGYSEKRDELKKKMDSVKACQQQMRSFIRAHENSSRYKDFCRAVHEQIENDHRIYHLLQITLVSLEVRIHEQLLKKYKLD